MTITARNFGGKLFTTSDSLCSRARRSISFSAVRIGSQKTFFNVLKAGHRTAARGERCTFTQEIDSDREQICLRVPDRAALGLFGTEQAQIDLLRQILRILAMQMPAPEKAIERELIFRKFLRPNVLPCLLQACRPAHSLHLGCHLSMSVETANRVRKS